MFILIQLILILHGLGICEPAYFLKGICPLQVSPSGHSQKCRVLKQPRRLITHVPTEAEPDSVLPS